MLGHTVLHFVRSLLAFHLCVWEVTDVCPPHTAGTFLSNGTNAMLRAELTVNVNVPRLLTFEGNQKTKLQNWVL